MPRRSEAEQRRWDKRQAAVEARKIRDLNAAGVYVYEIEYVRNAVAEEILDAPRVEPQAPTPVSRPRRRFYLDDD